MHILPPKTWRIYLKSPHFLVVVSNNNLSEEDYPTVYRHYTVDVTVVGFDYRRCTGV